MHLWSTAASEVQRSFVLPVKLSAKAAVLHKCIHFRFPRSGKQQQWLFQMLENESQLELPVGMNWSAVDENVSFAPSLLLQEPLLSACSKGPHRSSTSSLLVARETQTVRYSLFSSSPRMKSLCSTSPSR
jgi:hypothetical protein